MRRYYIATYGCQMNQYDSDMLAAMLERNSCFPAEGPEDADIILVNTCSVRKKAEDNAYARMRQLKPLKTARPEIKVAVIGCMAKNHGAKVQQTLDFVDFVMGPDNYKELEGLLFGNERDSVGVYTEFHKEENYEGETAKLQHKHSSFVAIQRGCNKRCTYCIVPFVRGNEKFRDTPDILREVKEAADQGVCEITLLGQTVNSYRQQGIEFPELLSLVADVPGIERVRFTSPHPRHYTPALLELLTQHPAMCPHVHLPLQSGSDRILKKMRRQYTAAEFLDIVSALRANNPRYAITTDIIVGFVGEEEEDFLQTLEIVEKSDFDNAFMFIYSPREGTKAYGEIETLSEDQKKERLQKLIELQNLHTAARAQQMLGQKERVLVDGPSSRNPLEAVGKTGNFKKVILPAEGNYQTGDWVDCEIVKVEGWTLIGKPV